jgi:DNA-binding MarR family transcriptional regulator
LITGEFWLGLGIGLGVSAVAFAGLWWSFRRLIRRREASRAMAGQAAPSSNPSPVSAPAAVVGDPPLGPIAVPAAPDSGPSFGGSSPTSTAATPKRWPPISADPATAEPTLPDSDESRVRLSQRVLQHLARRGGAFPASPGDETLTQRGIGSALGVTQGALSSVLGRLEDGGAIASEKAHVKGRDRRVKIYVLTPRGRELAARIPANGPATPPGTAASPRRSVSPRQVL